MAGTNPSDDKYFYSLNSLNSGEIFWKTPIRFFRDFMTVVFLLSLIYFCGYTHYNNKLQTLMVTNDEIAGCGAVITTIVASDTN